MQIISENILGYQVTTGSQGKCIKLIVNWINDDSSKRYFVCANPHSIITAENDPLFSKSLRSADLTVPDGIGIVLASKIFGGNIKERITGSDIFLELSRKLNEEISIKRSYFFLGSTNDTLAKIKRKMSKDFPNIIFAGSFSPPYRDEFNEEDSRLMIEAVNSAKPDVLWVGMTAPKQEKWVYQNKDKLGVKFVGAIGAVFDFYVGNVKRSHPIFQKIGLEWLPRLFQEPRRLWKRNFISSPLFIIKVLLCRFR